MLNKGLSSGLISLQFYNQKINNSNNTNNNPGSVQLDYVSNNDTNGVFYYRGTNNGATSWTNPQEGQRIIISASTENGDKLALSDRIDSNNSSFYTANSPNQTITIDLNPYQLVCNTYNLQNFDDYIVLNWILTGSNDNSNFTTLDTVNGVPATAYAWNTRTVSTTNAYRYFRIQMVGADSRGSNYMGFSEIEFYGNLSLI